MTAVTAETKFPSLRAVRAERMRRSLYEFFIEAWKVIEPGTPLLPNWHLRVICDHVQALLEGRLDKNNLAIAVPPGSAKSTIVSVCAPAWWWLHEPSWRGLFACGSETFATRDSMKCRDLITSDWYQQTFRPQWSLARDQNEKRNYKNSMTGFRAATTTQRKITGSRPTAMFIDDPLDATEAFSKVARQMVMDWWAAAGNRLANMVTGKRCLIMQRLHQEDPFGYITGLEPDEWEVVVIPQEWDETMRFTSSLGWTDPRTIDGDLMFPARFPERVLKGERLRLGSSVYQGQHQQRPSAAEGEIFKRGHVQFMHPHMLPQKSIEQIVASWDTAVKEKQQNDWSVSLIGIKFDRGIFIAEENRMKTGYSGLKEATKLQSSKWNLSALVIEDTQSGQALIQELRDTTDLPVVAVSVHVDKVARAHPCVPYWEANRIFFPCDDQGNPEPWVIDFLTELYAFPKGSHDDRVDAFTQLITYLVLRNMGGGIIEWYKSQTTIETENSREEKAQDAKLHPVDFIKLMGA